MESDKLLETYKNNLVLATELLKTHPDGIKVAGAMTITFDNAAYVFIDGIKDKYSSLVSFKLPPNICSKTNQQTPPKIALKMEVAIM